jgi:hypothetical protein
MLCSLGLIFVPARDMIPFSRGAPTTVMTFCGLREHSLQSSSDRTTLLWVTSQSVTHSRV